MAHRLVFTAIEAVAATSTPDLVTVGMELRRRGELEEVGAPYYSALVDGIAPPAADSVVLLTATLAELADLAGDGRSRRR
jgi:replicative DNA helicase